MLKVAFVGGNAGTWSVDSIRAVAGDALPAVSRLAVLEAADRFMELGGEWVLRGETSFERYVTSQEHAALEAASPPLGRATSSAAALIPIRKSDGWWAKPQEERRAIFEERSHHISRSLPYLPRVARRLHHSRQLGEPFDFLTWFEFSPRDSAAFDELLAALRTTEEWSYVIREVEIRLTRAG